jgi:hypothetical protein
MVGCSAQPPPPHAFTYTPILCLSLAVSKFIPFRRPLTRDHANKSLLKTNVPINHSANRHRFCCLVFSLGTGIGSSVRATRCAWQRRHKFTSHASGNLGLSPLLVSLSRASLRFFHNPRWRVCPAAPLGRSVAHHQSMSQSYTNAARHTACRQRLNIAALCRGARATLRAASLSIPLACVLHLYSASSRRSFSFCRRADLLAPSQFSHPSCVNWQSLLLCLSVLSCAANTKPPNIQHSLTHIREQTCYRVVKQSRHAGVGAVLVRGKRGGAAATLSLR